MISRPVGQGVARDRMSFSEIQTGGAAGVGAKRQRPAVMGPPAAFVNEWGKRLWRVAGGDSGGAALVGQAGAQPAVPVVQAFARAGRDREDADAFVEHRGVAGGPLQVEVHVGQQVDLV